MNDYEVVPGKADLCDGCIFDMKYGGNCLLYRPFTPPAEWDCDKGNFQLRHKLTLVVVDPATLVKEMQDAQK